MEEDPPALNINFIPLYLNSFPLPPRGRTVVDSWVQGTACIPEVPEQVLQKASCPGRVGDSREAVVFFSPENGLCSSQGTSTEPEGTALASRGVLAAYL